MGNRNVLIRGETLQSWTMWTLLHYVTEYMDPCDRSHHVQGSTATHVQPVCRYGDCAQQPLLVKHKLCYSVVAEQVDAAV